MGRRIFIVILIVALGVAVCGLFWPQKTGEIAGTIIKGAKTIDVEKLPFIGSDGTFKIVDPSTLAAIKDKTSRLALGNGNTLVVEDIIDETNRQRIAEGLPPLKVSTLLTASAKMKTEDMIKNNYFEHESPTGVMVSDLGKKVGYDYIIMGENLALGNFDDAEDLVDAWMNSPGHRANILNTLYQEIGIYAAKGTYDGKEVWFAVQHFGTSRNVCPAISKSLKLKIEEMNGALDRQQKEIELLKQKIETSDARAQGYEDDVDLFNSMVNFYNTTLTNSRGNILDYNAQVAAFNHCLSKYQK